MAETQTPTAGAAAPPAGSSVNPLFALLTTLGMTGVGKYLSNNSANSNVPPELRQLLSQQVERQAYQNPNFQAVTQGVHAMLPGFATQGTSMGPGLSNTPPPMPSGSGGSNPLSNPLLSGALGKALGDMAGGNIPFKDIIDKLKSLFGHGGTVQGNKPYPGGALPSGNPGMNGFTGWDNGPDYGPSQSGDPGNYLPSDPGVYWGENGGGAQPTDPSGGTGVGPGMQSYYDWLATQHGQSGGDGDSGPTGTDWWDE